MVRKKHKSLVELTCKTKVAWPSRRTAERARRHHVQTLDFDGKDRSPLVVYRCPYCGQWHSGHEDVVKNRIEQHERHRQQEMREALLASEEE